MPLANAQITGAAMPLPRQYDVEVPLLKVLVELGGQAVPADVYGRVAKFFHQITEDDLRARMESGNVQWWNHVQWARQKLVERGEIDRSVPGLWQITDAGRLRAGAEPANTAGGKRRTKVVSKLPVAIAAQDSQSP